MLGAGDFSSRNVRVFARTADAPSVNEAARASPRDDVLLVKERPEERTVEIRLGVIDSPRLPLRSNHQRWRRLLEVVERVLVPLSKTATIEKIHVV